LLKFETQEAFGQSVDIPNSVFGRLLLPRERAHEPHLSRTKAAHVKMAGHESCTSRGAGWVS
jgi:hypothetical protein